jgi:hypothetical protein
MIEPKFEFGFESSGSKMHEALCHLEAIGLVPKYIRPIVPINNDESSSELKFKSPRRRSTKSGLIKLLWSQFPMTRKKSEDITETGGFQRTSASPRMNELRRARLIQEDVDGSFHKTSLGVATSEKEMLKMIRELTSDDQRRRRQKEHE